MADDLWKWTATETVSAIGEGRISSREAVTSCLRRLEEVNPTVNAVVDVLAEEALTAADLADEAIRGGARLGPLHGVPVTVKINVDYAGRPTTNGVVAFRDLIAKDDSVPVANLRDAGAIIVGRTNVPAFSSRYFTDNALHGRTLNPWRPEVTPGGSSGGAASAVAVGIGPLGHGNDRAGSIRYPAFACGVFGLKPTLGRVPDFNPSTTEERGIASQLFNVQGPIARSTSDIRLGLKALEKRDSRDPWWVPIDSARIARPQSQITVATLGSLPNTDVDSAVGEAVSQTGKWLEGAGYKVEEVVPPRFAEAAELFWPLLIAEDRAASKDEKAASTSGIDEYGDEPVRRARAAIRAQIGEVSYETYIKALARRTSILREWMLFFDRYPLLVMPVSWQRPFPVDYDQQGHEAMRHILASQSPMLAVSVLGLPALAAPTGIVDGIPVGVQIVAGRFQEELCLTAGEVVERHSPLGAAIDPYGWRHPN